jgi:uncharacterized membrane protein YebE (DUF533 family)
MLNAAKADGKIDAKEMEKIIGRLDDDGLTREEQDFLVAEASRPGDLAAIVAAGSKRPDLAAQIYSASLLAIDIDTAAEQEYMRSLAEGLGLEREVVEFLEKRVGL